MNWTECVNKKCFLFGFSVIIVFQILSQIREIQTKILIIYFFIVWISQIL
jgi:hypothetical protein